MKRRTLDILFGIGGLVVALLLVVVGIVMTSNANFAKNYVADQLGQQHITFKTVDTLTDEEKAQACLVTYAGQKLTTGKQAECYANNFIGLHVKGIANGQTYADLGGPQTQARNALTAAQQANPNDPAIADLQKQLDGVTAQRDTLFKGETLRAILLNGYGWWTVATIALYAGWVMVFAGLALLVLGFLGFRHSRKATVVVTQETTKTPDYASASA